MGKIYVWTLVIVFILIAAFSGFGQGWVGRSSVSVDSQGWREAIEELNNKVADLEADNVILNNRMTALETDNTTINAKVDAIEIVNVALRLEVDVLTVKTEANRRASYDLMGWQYAQLFHNMREAETHTPARMFWICDTSELTGQKQVIKEEYLRLAGITEVDMQSQFGDLQSTP